MKPLWSSICLVALAGPTLREDETLAYAPEEGTTLSRVFEATGETTFSRVEAVLDGEIVGEAPGVAEVESLERISVTDEIESVEDGRPTELVRTFDELLQESTVTFTLPDGDEESVDSTSTSDLEGSSLRYTWDEGAGEYSIESEDEDLELDEDVLAYLLEDMDLRGFLPDEEVEEGDSWAVEDEAYLSLMWPGGLLDFYEIDEEIDEESASLARERNEHTIDRMSGEGEVTFSEIREEGGLRLAVLEVEMDISTDADSVQEDEMEMEVALEVRLERSIEGEILWDLDHGHLSSATLTADTEMVITRARTLETPEGDEVDLEEIEYHDGTIDYEVLVERYDD